MTADDDLVTLGDYSTAWLEPTAELRFILRDGLRVLQQRWEAKATEMRDGVDYTHRRWRWKDVALDENPRDSS